MVQRPSGCCEGAGPSSVSATATVAVPPLLFRSHVTACTQTRDHIVLKLAACVSAQIMDSECVTMNDDGEPLEAVVTGSKHHDHLVQTIGWYATPVTKYLPPLPPPAPRPPPPAPPSPSPPPTRQASASHTGNLWQGKSLAFKLNSAFQLLHSVPACHLALVTKHSGALAAGVHCLMPAKGSCCGCRVPHMMRSVMYF